MLAMWWLLGLVLMGAGSNGELYTSMTDMSHLLTTEGEMIRAVENYILAQEEKLQKLKRDMLEMERVHDIASKAPEKFLGNPINAYLLVKRLTVDWADIQNVLTADSVGQAMLGNLTSMADLLHWPDEEDLNGAATALMRLQDTYNLDTSQLARGFINGKKQAYRELSAADCFELGRQSYNSGDHYHTTLWMNEALSIHDTESNKTVDRADILEYLAFSTYMQGNVRQALKLTNELLLDKPNHQRAIGNKIYYEEALQNQQSQQREESHSLDADAVEKGYTVSEDLGVTESWQKERRAYEKLCRGEGRVPKKIANKLVCFYQHGPSKYLQINPVKGELAYIHPTIIIYHDVISDKEIAVVKEMATPRFKRATVQNYKTGELETASYRISKSSWLKNEESEHVATINQRIEYITGLNMDTAEELQVANYGLGGHYEPHFDFARKDEVAPDIGLGPWGNRIATFLFYMSDVEAGGATVFPHLGLSLWPKKGAAAFWYNLHPNGEGDLLTRHAACPVLVGTKWVSNKWIHERGQEFRRPCSLDINAL